jgi:hypothetical protein
MFLVQKQGILYQRQEVFLFAKTSRHSRLHLAARLRMSGVITPIPYRPSWCAPEFDGKKCVQRKVYVHPPKINKPHVT